MCIRDRGYTEALRYDLIGRLRQVDGRQNSAVWSYGLDYNDNDELSRMWYTRGSEAANAVNYTCLLYTSRCV